MRCGACRGEHATVAEVRACHAGGQAAPGATVATVAPAAGPAAVDDVDAALAALAGAGLAPEVLLHLRRGRRR